MPLPTADLRRLSLSLLVALACAPAAAQVSNCEPLREQIAARFKAGGLPQVKLVVMEAAASAPGRVVGTCERGTRKIVQVNEGTAPPRPAARSDDALLTECRDGRVQMGGSCRR
ncbi:MAG: hypothetical protein RLZZ598_912 [Pseudomonadota bacterium]|jgi:hypothetical protein